MSKELCPEAVDGGPAYIQANCSQLVAVIAFTPGDSYATVMNPANVVASVPMSSGDFSFTAGAAGSRVFNNAAKTDSAAEAAGDPTHFVFVNATASKILRVTDENTTGSATLGGAVSFPNLPLIGRQPVAA